MEAPLGTAVISDASSVLGRACAHFMANEGYDLLLAGRDRCGLNPHANDITTRTCRNVEVCQVDLDRLIDRVLFIEKIRRDASVSLVVLMRNMPFSHVHVVGNGSDLAHECLIPAVAACLKERSDVRVTRALVTMVSTAA